jgi:hypothetical protein
LVKLIVALASYELAGADCLHHMPKDVFAVGVPIAEELRLAALIEHKITIRLVFGSGLISAAPEDFQEKGARTAGW